MTWKIVATRKQADMVLLLFKSARSGKQQASIPREALTKHCECCMISKSWISQKIQEKNFLGAMYIIYTG